MPGTCRGGSFEKREIAIGKKLLIGIVMGWKDCETRSATKERWNERKFEGKTARKNERRKQTMHHGMNDLFSE